VPLPHINFRDSTASRATMLIIEQGHKAW
jgi:hypothetical protein